jgi:Flp pilus assembly protein TadD
VEKEVDEYNERGVAYAKHMRFIEAIKEFNKALEIEPDNITAYNNRSQCINLDETFSGDKDL